MEQTNDECDDMDDDDIEIIFDELDVNTLIILMSQI